MHLPRSSASVSPSSGRLLSDLPAGTRRPLTGLLAAAVLAACGGGGGSDTPATAPGATVSNAATPDPATGTPSTSGGSGSTGSPATPVTSPAAPNSVALLQQDLSAAHELLPAAVSGSWWAAGQTLKQGNAQPAGAVGLGGYGQLYAAAGTVPANTRVELRNFETFVRRQSTGAWTRVQFSGTVTGRFYPADYASTTGGADGGEQPSAEGYTTIQPRAGMVYRFWPQGGIAMGQLDPADVAGVFTTVQARLVPASAAVPDDRAGAAFAVATGADWWYGAQPPADAFGSNPVVGNGRLHQLTGSWRAANFASVAAASLAAAPPPLTNSARAGDTRPTRIMVIGDSISQGMTAALLNQPVEHPSFRRALWHTLLARTDLPMIDFVGARNGLAGSDGSCIGTTNGQQYSTVLATPQAYDYDGDHEAYFGSCTNEVTSQVVAHMTQTPALVPDVALVHVGTNDLGQQKVDGGTVTSRLADLVTALRAANPSVRVLLSRIIPQAGGVDRASVNAQITALGARLGTAASPVTVIDQDVGFDATANADTFDGTHPNGSGEAKLAARYAAGLATAMPPAP